MEWEISTALLLGPGVAAHLTVCTSHCAPHFSSRARAGSQGECHTTLACVIPAAVGRDSSHIPWELWEERPSAASPKEWSHSSHNRIEGTRATRPLSTEEGTDADALEVWSTFDVQPL